MKNKKQNTHEKNILKSISKTVNFLKLIIIIREIK